MTPEVTGLPSLLPPLAAAKHAEDYNKYDKIIIMIKEGVFI